MIRESSKQGSLKAGMQTRQLFKPSENMAAKLLQLGKPFRRNGFNYKKILFLTYLRLPF